MKKIPILLLSVLLMTVRFVTAQTIITDSISPKKDKKIHWESGINLSVPVHVQMYRSHRFEIGLNLRAWRKISPKWELGIKFDYDYWLVKKKPPVLTP